MAKNNLCSFGGICSTSGTNICPRDLQVRNQGFEFEVYDEHKLRGVVLVMYSYTLGVDLFYIGYICCGRHGPAHRTPANVFHRVFTH